MDVDAKFAKELASVHTLDGRALEQRDIHQTEAAKVNAAQARAFEAATAWAFWHDTFPHLAESAACAAASRAMGTRYGEAET